MHSARSLSLFGAGLFAGVFAIAALARLGSQEPAPKADPKAPKKAFAAFDAIEDAQTPRPVVAVRPEQKLTDHDKGDFSEEASPPSSPALDQQNEKGRFNGFDFARDPLGSEKPKMTLDEIMKADIAAKGITFVAEIEQSKLAAAVGNKIGRSTLLIFGNPALGTQFMRRSQESGIDWPVRILVFQDPSGAVWAEYTDFVWIARRHGIASDDVPFNTANGVVASITSSVAK